MMTRSSTVTLLAGAALLFTACDDGGDGGGTDDGPIRAYSGAPDTDRGAPLPAGGLRLSAGGAPTPDTSRARIHFVGRFDRSNRHAPRFAWPGSAIWTRFDGSELTVKLNDTGPNQFDVVIDDGPAELLVVTPGLHTYTLASGLDCGPHDLRLTRRTETFIGTTEFHGFSGSPLLRSPAPDRWIEFVGDSITCGYGVIGDGPNCGFSPDTEAETHAYGALAAAELGAAHTAIAWSGRGMVRNFNNEPGAPMPGLWTRTIASEETSTWDFSLPEPAAVIINLGTNDFSVGDPGQPFVDAYDSFVQTLRSRYPSAWIFAATSPMLSDGFPVGQMHRTLHRQHLEAVVAAAAERQDRRVSFLELAEQDANDGLGCDFHPNEVTNEKMADVVVQAIRDVTDW